MIQLTLHLLAQFSCIFRYLSGSSPLYSMSTCSQHENLFRRRDFSGELEVFDAAQYFHAADDFYNEHAFHTTPVAYAYSAVKSPVKSSLSSVTTAYDNVKPKNGNMKHRPPPPRSPGGKLASLLNALFVQTLTKKKKNQKSGENFADKLSGGQRMRRSSTSALDFGSTARKNTSSASDIHFPATKTHQERRNLMEKYRSSKVSCLNKFPSEKQGYEYPWMDEASNFISKNPEKTKIYQLRESKGINNDYDDAASDSSEDLFDLPNHHL